MNFRMRWGRAFVLAVVAVCAATAAAGQDRRARSDQQILIDLEQRWNAAFERKDLKFIENILADEFLATYPDGTRGDKAKELALVAEFNQLVASSTLDGFTVKVYGDTAVVWFSRHLVGVSQGSRHEVTYRYVDVFVWRGDRWQCVASQSTKVTGK
jgi:ketosteroid isomerase-like protein